MTFDVKAEIESLTGVGICDQKVYRDDQILKDWKTLGDCDMTKWSCVPPFTIHFYLIFTVKIILYLCLQID